MGARGVEDRLLDLVGEVYAQLDLEAFRTGVLEALARAVETDWVSLNVFTEDPAETLSIVSPPLPLEVYDRFAEHAHEHPLVQLMMDAGGARPIRLSDVITREALHRTPLYREVFSLIGLEYQVAFSLPAAPGHVVGIALSRRETDFSDEDCAFLDRARPHIVQAYRNAREHTRLKRRLADEPVSARADLPAYGLTPREVDAIRCVATGLANRDIAVALGVSERTVQKHLERAYRKLGVRSRSEAARVAWRLNLDTVV